MAWASLWNVMELFNTQQNSWISYSLSVIQGLLNMAHVQFIPGKQKWPGNMPRIVHVWTYTRWHLIIWEWEQIRIFSGQVIHWSQRVLSCLIRHGFAAPVRSVDNLAWSPIANHCPFLMVQSWNGIWPSLCCHKRQDTPQLWIIVQKIITEIFLCCIAGFIASLKWSLVVVGLWVVSSLSCG